MATPPGWYDDPNPPPERPDQLRWWDGDAWTSHVHSGTPVSQQAAPAGPHGPPMAYGATGTAAAGVVTDAEGGRPARGPGRLIALIVVAAALVLGGVAVAVVLILGGDGGASAPYDGEPTAVPTTPYEIVVPDGWDTITDTNELLVGRLGVAYEGDSMAGPFGVVLVVTEGEPDLFVPPSRTDPEAVARSNAESFIAYFFPETSDLFTGELEDDVRTLTDEPVELAGEEGFRVTLAHEASDAVVDVLAIGGDDPLLLVAAVEAITEDPEIEELVGQILESLGRA